MILLKFIKIAEASTIALFLRGTTWCHGKALAVLKFLNYV